MFNRLIRLLVIAVLTVILSTVQPALAAPAKHAAHKRHTTNHSVPGYGFLPGVRTPAQTTGIP